MAPPSGTSGKSPGRSAFNCVSIPCESTPHPDCTATYWRPPARNDVGGPMIPEWVGNRHSSFPLLASNAWNSRSFVPPENTRPPPVASIGPQLGDVAYVCVHTRLPVSTFHACTSPTWSAPSAMENVYVAPTYRCPGEYDTDAPVIVSQRFSFAGM